MSVIEVLTLLMLIANIVGLVVDICKLLFDICNRKKK